MDVSDPTESVTPLPAFTRAALVSNSNTSHRLSNNGGINIRVIPINLHEKGASHGDRRASITRGDGG